jgi:regulation of enolase protein 1 (concanavalin A-like superfamily)
MIACLLATVVVAAPVPKETPAKRIERLWGATADPENTDAFALRDANTLRLTVARGLRGINPARNLNNCPRTLKPISGDFTVTVKMLRDGAPDGAERASNDYTASGGGGLLLWHDEKNHLRISRSQWIAENGGKAKSTYNFRGNIDGEENPSVQTELNPTTSPVVFRLTRKGTSFTASYSADGKTWTDFEAVEAEFPRDLKVGIYGAHNFNKDNIIEFEPLTVILPGPKP